MNNREYQYTNITAGTNGSQIFTGRGILQAITVNTTANGVIKIVDGLTGSTANVGTLKASVAEGTYWYNASISQGLRIATAAASDITVTYAQG